MSRRFLLLGAVGGTRTHTAFRLGDFKSPVSTNSTTAAGRSQHTLIHFSMNEVRSGVEPL